jgi:hypothetical protein
VGLPQQAQLGADPQIAEADAADVRQHADDARHHVVAALRQDQRRVEAEAEALVEDQAGAELAAGALRDQRADALAPSPSSM